jgi:hypothetical protein
VLDVQECPLADLAIAALVAAAVRAHVEERWIPYEQQKRYAVEPLHDVLLDTIRYAEHTRIRDSEFLRAYGVERSLGWAGDLWKRMTDQLLPDHPVFTPVLRTMQQKGTLATRISQRVQRFPTRIELRAVYRELAECLEAGRLFGVA